MTQTPSVNFTILSGGLGNQPASPSETICVFGCSSGGAAATIQGPYVGNPAQVVTDNGYGPGPELAAYLTAAGVTVLFCKLPSTTAGTASAVVPTGTGASVMTVTGVPLDAYNVIVTTAVSGTVGTAPEPTFTVSLDGGLTVSAQIRMPTSGVYTGLASTTGMTLNFTTATMVAGDTYSFTTTPPLWNDAGVTAGLAALLASPKL